MCCFVLVFKKLSQSQPRKPPALSQTVSNNCRTIKNSAQKMSKVAPAPNILIYSLLVKYSSQVVSNPPVN